VKKLSDGTRLILFVSIIIAIFFGITVLPVVQFNDTAIRMFAPQRLEFSGRGFNGRVFGTHVLETEYGEIILKSFARVLANRYGIAIIDVENFANDRATHNLVVGGMDMPSNIRIVFSYRQQYQISLLQLDNQEIILSGIPISVTTFDLEPRGFTADIRMGFIPPDYIELTDTTIIHFPLARPEGFRFLRALYMHKDEELWVIIGRTYLMRPWETEFTEYRSITFGANWGAFIDGVPFE